MSDIKTCTKCGIEQPIKNFSLSQGKPRSRCKTCHNTYVREIWYRKNAEKQKESSRKWRERNRDKVFANRHGVDVEDVTPVLLITACQICGDTEQLCIDHDHDTMEIRGRLCTNCNIGLGRFKDSPALLQNAIVYLNGGIGRA